MRESSPSRCRDSLWERNAPLALKSSVTMRRPPTAGHCCVPSAPGPAGRQPIRLSASIHSRMRRPVLVY